MDEIQLTEELTWLRNALKSRPFSAHETMERVRDIGDPAIQVLVDELRDRDSWVHVNAIDVLALWEPPAIEALGQALTSEYSRIRERSAVRLADLGQDGREKLLGALKHLNPEVREAAVSGLEKIGEPIVEELKATYLQEENTEVRLAIVNVVGNIARHTDNPIAVEVLISAIRDIDPDIIEIAVQYIAYCNSYPIEAGIEIVSTPSLPGKTRFIDMLYYKLTSPFVVLAAIALEDSVLKHRVSAKRALFRMAFDFQSDVCVEEVIDTLVSVLIVRNNQRPDELFSSEIVSDTFNELVEQNARLSNYIKEKLVDVAFSTKIAARKRAVDVARRLDKEEFASLVKECSAEQPEVAANIIRLMGGSEATAYFTELQMQSLADYRAPLIDLEDTARERWEELTKQSRLGFYVNMGMSVGVFIVGVGTVIWGLILLTKSSSTSQQVTGGVLSAIAALATTFSGRFWKDPVEHILRFSAQQARLQVAMIGFMNRVAQLRLVFEENFIHGELPLDALEVYQAQLRDASQEVFGQLTLKME